MRPDGRRSSRGVALRDQGADEGRERTITTVDADAAGGTSQEAAKDVDVTSSPGPSPSPVQVPPEPQTPAAPPTPMPSPRLRTAPQAAKTPVPQASPTAAGLPIVASGERCGVPSGYGGYGAKKSRTTGPTTVTVEAYMCESYDGEPTQIFTHIEDSGGVVRSLHLDYGDGTANDQDLSNYCGGSGASPYSISGPPHTFAAPGAYTVKATVAMQRCPADASSANDLQTATVEITVYRVAGPRPTS